MSAIPIGTPVIGTDGAKIYYGPVRSDEGVYYTIYSLKDSEYWWWLPKKNVVPLDRFVPSYDQLSRSLPSRQLKKGMPVLFFLLSENSIKPYVGLTEAGLKVQYPIWRDGKCAYESQTLVVYFDMAQVIDLYLEPYMKMVEDEK